METICGRLSAAYKRMNGGRKFLSCRRLYLLDLFYNAQNRFNNRLRHHIDKATVRDRIGRDGREADEAQEHERDGDLGAHLMRHTVQLLFLFRQRIQRQVAQQAADRIGHLRRNLAAAHDDLPARRARRSG